MGAVHGSHLQTHYSLSGLAGADLSDSDQLSSTFRMSEKLTVFLTFLFADTFTAHRERRKIQTITDSTELSDFLPIFLTTHQAEKSERREPQLHD